MTLLQTTIRPRRSQRRGIILVFVVVLLVLLAIMGTAYLASTRADLVTIRGRGAGPNANSPLLVDTTNLDNVTDAVQERLKIEVGLEDLLGTNAGDSATANANLTAQQQYFRQGTRTDGTVWPADRYSFDAPGDSTNPQTPGVDNWLASTLPNLIGNVVVWPWVSGPTAANATSGSIALDGFFADPRYISATNFTAGIVSAADSRNNVPIGSLELKATPRAKTNRVYPALFAQNAAGSLTGADPNNNPAKVAIAGDADGDGIADSYLVPVQINPSATGNPINKYVDETNGVVYFYCFRVVDNSSMLNLGTALSMKSDFPLLLLPGDGSSADSDPRSDFANETRGMVVTNTPTAATAYTPDYGTFQPSNYGFFRSNVGLIELLKESLDIYTGQTGANAVNAPTQTDIRRLVDLRIPNLDRDPTGNVADQTFRMVAPNSNVFSLYHPGGTYRTAAAAFEPYFFISLGDMLEQQALRRAGDPGGYNIGNPTALNMLASPPGATDLSSLHDKGGSLINPQVASSSVETALSVSLRATTPNFSGKTDNIWKWFPADQVRLWYEWTKNLDGFRRAAGDPLFQPTFDFDPGTAPFNTAEHAGMTRVELQRSIRSILTTYNGTSPATPVRADPPSAASPTGDLPVGMPKYPAVGANADLDIAPYGEYPASKVSAATGTKRQLWRAFWSAMTRTLPGGTWDTEVNGTAQYPAFLSALRYAGPDNKINSRNMARIRSAIAAVNTIDLRDDDTDITSLDVELEVQTAQANGSGGNVAMVARVFGTERRPFITEVNWVDGDGKDTGDPTQGPYLAIEIFNPYDEDIDLSDYYLGVVTRTSILPNLSNAETQATAVPIQNLDGTFLGASPILPPGQFVVIATSASSPAGGTPALVGTPPYHARSNTLPAAYAELSSGNELVLARRRRADNVSTTYPAPQLTATNELPDTAADAILRMVPIETIDMRQVVPVGSEPTQFQYRRYSSNPLFPTTPPVPPPNDSYVVRDRWKCVYGGQFYIIDANNPNASDPNARPDPIISPAARPAWHKFAAVSQADPTVAPGADATYLAAVDTLGVYETSPAGPPTTSTFNEPYATSSIQIQNFKVNTTAHPANRFPYGSPFARDADILNVPFIGAYHIYRKTGNVYTLMESTALPTDAFLAEPIPTVPATNPSVENPSVGRFDPTQASTRWADDLLDFMTARQAPAHDFFPDVPKVTLHNNATTDFSNVATDQLAYVGGDGPVQGMTADAQNPDTTVAWSEVGGLATRRAGQKIVEGTVADEDLVTNVEALTLTQGKININTAPPVVLRTLAMTVSPTNGQFGAAQLAGLQTMVDQIVTERNDTTNASKGPFKSLFSLMSRVPTLTADPNLPPAVSYTTAQLLNLGDLSGNINKPDSDFQRQSFNLSRVSNILTTRSDVFTVYVSVQAWTYRPGVTGWNQATDTRLVGERRTSFVLDRSQIAPGNDISVGSLRIFPVANE